MTTIFSRYNKENLRIGKYAGMMGCWIALLLGGCDSFVEVDVPSSQLTTTAVFQDKATAEAALLDIYAKIRDTGMLFGDLPGISNALGNYTDELVSYGSASDVSQGFYTNNLMPSNATVNAWWSSAYSQIYAANLLIEGLTASTSISQPDKAKLRGEALFIRGLLHFYLANIYGDVPYITTTDYRQNRQVNRTAVTNVYQAVITDLGEAAELLAEPSAEQRIRANKATVIALLARVYLYAGKYPEAADCASYLINNNTLYSLEAPGGAFLEDSRETIWHLMPQNQGQNTREGAAFIFIAGPPQQVALSNSLIDAFEPGDLRRANWVNAVSDGSSTWYHAYKYKERGNTASSLEYSVLLRLAEQYLIRAEARAMQGDLIGAKDDVDKIRFRAGLGNTPAETQAEILDAILKERQVELFTETGHRFFDLKRSGYLDQVLTPVKTGWESTDRLLPLPENELLLNPNLSPQNPGY